MADHDSLYHRLFSHPLMVEALIRDFVPEAMALDLDFAGMARVNAKFHSRRGSRREGDVIWRLPTKAETDIYLYLHMEFQSEVDVWMSVRTQVYEGLLWQQVIAERKLKNGDQLPPVLMVVLYNGESRWTAPTETRQMIALPPDSPLWHWQPQIRYYLLDMGAVSGNDLIRRDSLAALLFRLEQRHRPDELGGLIDEMIAWFRQHPGYDGLKSLFAELVQQAIDGLGAKMTLPGDLAEAKTMLATLGERWKQEWLAEGEAKGRAEGEAKGEAKALVRLLEKRFGSLSEDLRRRVFAANIESIEAWFDRAIDAPNVNTVFADAR